MVEFGLYEANHVDRQLTFSLPLCTSQVAGSFGKVSSSCGRCFSISIRVLRNLILKLTFLSAFAVTITIMFTNVAAVNGFADCNI